jgi:hypothetical protein
MKHLALFVILVGTFWSSGQNYGNEWIDYNQQYYKFPVTETGIYQITFSSMVAAGIPASSISPSDFQVYGRERELPLKVVDGGDNSFDVGDYIEFFAERNDGWLDSILYDDPNTIGNPVYSLYNDTIYYFLSWGSGVNKRYSAENDINFPVYSPRDYFLQKTTRNYNSNFYGGYSFLNSYSSYYEPGEGWGGANLNGASGASLTIGVSTPSPYTGIGAPPVQFQGKSHANSNAAFTGTGNHHLRWEVGTNNLVLYDEVFSGYRHTIANEPFSVNNLSNGTTNVFFKIIGDQGAITDYQSVNYVELIYPRSPNLNNQSFIDFTIENSPTQAKNRYDFTNANLVNPRCFVTGGLVSRSIPMVQNGGLWQVLIPNSGNGVNQRIIIASETEIKPITLLTPVNGSGFFTPYTTFNFEEAYLIYYQMSLENGATQYQAYRASATGGGHNALKFDVDELYMQFGGGIPKHALGLRRLAQMAYDLSTEKPVGLLILGKGVREANEVNSLLGAGTRKNATSYNMNLVPSYGYPSSDICFTSKFNGTNSWRPFIPIGRVSARNNNEVVAYLEKVQVYESAQDQSDVYDKPNKEWQKQVLHFGGGSVLSEQNLFQGYLNNMKNIIENQQFGGNVSSYFKDNSNPFNPVLTTDVNQKIENGVSLMTFFGHGSAGGGFDQNVDNPQNWNNAGKYPLVIGNSCYTGDIFMPNYNSTSEKFVMISNLGAIGFISSTKLGFASYLSNYTNELYKQMSLTNYGETFGRQIGNTIQTIQSGNSSFLMETTCTQMTLHGDPLVKTNWHALPEIDLTIQDVFFNPTQFNLSTDSIEVNVVLTNLGKSITTPFELVVRRNFPNSQIDSVYTVLIPTLHYKDTIKVMMPMQPNIGVGLNQFNITADIPSFIPENYDEYGNNEINTSLFINVEGIMPVLPYNYAVVPNDSVVLKASTINPIADYNTYRFEIDTTDLFNSPFRKYALVSGLGGVKEVFPNQWLNVNSNANSPLILSDSVAYFWRVAVDSVTPQWVEHSFQYIPGKEGWGQDHFFQFKNGGFTGLDYLRPSRTREFLEIEKVVGCDVYDNASNQTTINQTLWTLDAQEMEYGWCFTTPSIHVAVIDPLTMEPWGTFNNGENPNHQFGNVNNGAACRNRVEYYFIFRQNSTAQLQALQNMLENEIPEGHYVLLYTAARAEYANWQTYLPSMFTTMSNLGAVNMTPTSNDRAFIFFTQKGNSDYTTEVHAATSGEFISATIPILGLNNIGLETSTIIGPAAEWQTLFWKQDGLETPNNDETRLIIRGLDANQTVQLEIDTLFTANDSIINLNSLFPAQQYPYLQLRALYQDTSGLTPAQVDRWHVLYATLPEAAIDGTNQYTWTSSNAAIINEGEEITFAVDVKNISHLDMDSLLVHYWVVDENQNPHPIPYVRQGPLLTGGVLRDTITFSTVGLSGLNSFWMEVNPYTNFPLKDQPELAHFNNLLQIPFNVEPDDLNPLLDVTFDGLHILNGDIINPNGEIIITLKDDNPFLVMNQDADTSLFGIFLRYPDGIQKRVPFINGNGQQIMHWEPANGDNLKFKIIFPTEFTVEGEYELLVQGTDKSGNLSGDLEYRVNFEVLLSSSITHMMNYPNPFSTSTRFVFTLTGSKVPDEIKIQIMTVTGRIVREITEDELGPMRIGRNISQYAWDGRDEFGDQLANGVYLYRVQAQIEGEDIEHRTSGADQHFKKSWGKMYLMR